METAAVVKCLPSGLQEVEDHKAIEDKLKKAFEKYKEDVSADDSAQLNTKRALRESEEKIAKTQQQVVEMETAMVIMTAKQDEILKKLQAILEK